MQLGSHHDYVIGHPDYVQAVLLAGEKEMLRSIHRPLKRLLGNGLLGSQGELHVSQRRLIQPSFHKQRMAIYARAVAEHGERLRTRWRDGQVLEITEEMMHLTMAIGVKALLGVEVEYKAREIGQALETIAAMTNQAKVPFHSGRKFRKARAKLDDFVYQLIKERRATSSDQPDFLSELLKLQDPQGAAPDQSDEQVRDEALTMFAAGHETTASAMAWTWYLLSQHPQVENRMHRELDSVLAGRSPGVDDLPRLTYMAMVFSESMRLYPPVWIMTRRTLGNFRLGDYDVPPGSYIHVCQYLLHRDSRYFADPQRFDPMRWTPEEYATRPRFCYFPFGAGSRKCIGESFAFMEGMLLLAILAQHWTLLLVSGHKRKPRPLVTLRPGRGIMMKVQPRRTARMDKAARAAQA